MVKRFTQHILVVFVLWAAWGTDAQAANCFARANANWNVASTWASTSGGAGGTCAGNGAVANTPGSADNVTIGETTTNRTVTIPAGYAAAANSVVIGTTGGINGAKTLTLASGTSSLTVTGDLTVNKPSNNNSNALNINAGTVTVGGAVTLGGNTNNKNRDSRIVITSGTLNINGDLVFVDGTDDNNVLDMSGGAGRVNLKGAFTATVGTLASSATSVFNYNGSAAAQTVLIGVGAINYSNLYVNNTSAGGATLSAAISTSNVTGDMRAQSGILDNGGFSIAGNAGATIEVANGALFNLAGTSAMAAGFGTFSFGATSTQSYQGADQTVAAGLTYGHLILDGTVASVKTPEAGTITVAGNFAVQGTSTTYAGNTNNPNVNLAGNFTNSATTFNSGSGTYTFNSASAATQTLTGATTFDALRMNNSGAGLTINNDVTVNTLLTLTNGRVVTAGAFKVIIPSGGAVSSASASSFVAGQLQRFVAAGSSTVAFDIGTNGASAPALAYTPVSLSFTGVGAAGGSLIVSSTVGDHPQIATSSLAATKSVNRNWTLTISGVTGTALPVFTDFSATFNFLAADVDAGASTANFAIDRWNGAAWSTTTIGTRNPTNTQATGITGLGDFAIGEKVVVTPTPGSFNSFETSTGAAAITGRIFTKLVGTVFSLDVVAISGGAKLTAFTANVTVELLANTTAAALDAQNCPTTFTVIQGPTTVAIASGRSTVNFSAVATAYRDVRVRVRYPTSSPTTTSCSTDNFSIRPTGFSSVTSNMTNGTSTGAPVAKAGDAFSITAIAGAGYDGTPSIDATLVTAHAGAIQVGAIGGSFSAANSVTGTATSAAFTYSDVGNFTLGVNAAVDSGFTAVDPVGTDCTNNFSNSPVGGQYGCKFGNTAAAGPFGRFTPDHFDLGALNAPAFGTACTGFAYVGQRFNYTTAPVITVIARNSAGLGNATTRNYTGASWWKLGNAWLTYPVGTSRGYAALTGTLNTSGLPATDPVVADLGGGTSGMGTLTFSSGSGLLFTRAAPVAPFNAEIGLFINIIDSDNIVYPLNPVNFGAATAGGGIAFNSGKEQRFGRLRMQNASGSQLISMPIPIRTQYWNGNGFVTNTLDNCTTIAAGNISIGDPQNSLTVAMVSPPIVGGAFVAGIGSLRLPKPSSAVRGSVDVSVNLTGAAAGASCTAGMPASTGSGQSWLQGAWCGAAFDKDPTAQATFGIYSNTDQIIFEREKY